jgi:hypothetical protein
VKFLSTSGEGAGLPGWLLRHSCLLLDNPGGGALATAPASAPAGAGEAPGRDGQPDGEGWSGGRAGGNAGQTRPRPPPRPHLSLLPGVSQPQDLPLTLRGVTARSVVTDWPSRLCRPLFPTLGPVQFRAPASSLILLLPARRSPPPPFAE